MMRETTPMGLRDFVQYDYHMALIFDSACMQCVEHNHSPAFGIAIGATPVTLCGTFFLCSRFSPNDPMIAGIIFAAFAIISLAVILGSYREYWVAWHKHHTSQRVEKVIQ